MEVLENSVPVRAGQLVQRLDCGAAVASAGLRPGRQQSRREVGDRTADRLREILPRRGIAFLFKLAYAQHQSRNAVVPIHSEQAFAELARLLDIALGQHGEECAAEQVGITRIELEDV